jgi:non-ribosomal peptide synthetase component F
MKIIILAVLSFSVFASDLSQDHMLSVLDQMAKEGIVPAHEVPKVRQEIQAMTPSQFNQMKGLARDLASKHPQMNQATEPTLESAAQNVNVDSPEFKETSQKLEKILGK